MEDACPRHNYHLEDLEFRDRMKRAYMIAMLVTINLRGPLEQIRAAKIFCELHHLFTWGPKLVTVTAFLYGREYGRWESGAIESHSDDRPDDTAALLKARPDLREQLKQVREISVDGVRRVAEELKAAVGEAYAADVLSQWEGCGRFCRGTLGMEPLTVLGGYRLGTGDPSADVLASYPDAVIDEAKAEHWAGNWARERKRWFGTS